MMIGYIHSFCRMYFVLFFSKYFNISVIHLCWVTVNQAVSTDACNTYLHSTSLFAYPRIQHLTQNVRIIIASSFLIVSYTFFLQNFATSVLYTTNAYTHATNTK